MRMILISLLMLILGASTAQAVEFEYNFKDKTECTNQKHEEYTELMQEHQGKLAEVVRGGVDLLTFYKAWGQAAGTEYKGDADIVDVIFIFKSYPQAGLMFAYMDGCLVGARVLNLSTVNKILHIYNEEKRGI